MKKIRMLTSCVRYIIMNRIRMLKTVEIGVMKKIRMLKIEVETAL